MPRPRNERQAWTEELAELAEQLASYRRELNALPPVSSERREARVADQAGGEAGG